MILILLGTQDKPFTRLLDAVEKEIIKQNINEKVIVQAGYTKYDSKNMKIFDLIEPNELEKLIDEANLIITHGGVGSIISALKKEKKVIACPRLKKYNEHTNNHQLQIINTFSKEGYILNLDNPNDLSKLLKKVEEFKPLRFKSNNSKLLSIVSDYIDNS